YNCIAHAAGDHTKWWWPDQFWPLSAPREVTIDAFIQAFGSLGFSVALDGSLEADVEKIVLYAIQGDPQHAAVPLPNGQWSSKLGSEQDIEHALNSLEGAFYGRVVVVLQRNHHARVREVAQL
ncbi:MAG: hypothetical protein M3Y56_10185, partial [Armatimonadota bacterium]|nr:hypothetical protein [Armatimonadota bacterium]